MDRKRGKEPERTSKNGMEDPELVWSVSLWVFAFLLIGLMLVSTQGFIRLDMSEFQERHEVSESLR